MSKLQFATGLRQAYNIPEAARRIEDLGFDAACCGEHVMFHGDTANGFISLAQAAAATTTLKVMSAVISSWAGNPISPRMPANPSP